MGNYDNIQVPISGQPISASQFGVRTRDAILDLDRRMSAYDASTGVGKASATTTLTLTNTTETASLTIPGFTFRAGYAYRANMRMGVSSNPANGFAQVRIRKLAAGGTDWGEYFRYMAHPSNTGFVMSALGTIYLINPAVVDVVSDVVLAVQASANAVTVYGSVTSPRYFVIEPAGFASDYVGMGVTVS